ncbi:Calponin homology domain [Pseudocohnilembus persalinus]|uniref:Calponin homology domain n=1 Tax=Pseudocohnilembus persalinus TaxID=266149 RepID=A0A0V0QAQ9_PSEPJ|nr:Calponin homology domain [Pseudocohnilembus persalinus]|eukprot:KRW99159.1 Calponin homology domain [Pseudocohnilembus persalinus]
MDAPPLNEEELNSIYNWIDEIPLSRPKKNITRDFADGLLVAEVVAHYFPKLVEIHNYSQAHSISQKLYNWNTLNQKVFKKMGFQISKIDIDHVVGAVPDAIERVLKVVQIKLEKYSEQKQLKKQNNQNSMISNNQNNISVGMPMNQQQPFQPMYQPGMNPMQMGAVNNSMNMMPQQQGMMPQPNVQALIMEKDQTISELRETVEILELKIKKMEQLIKLKDSKIQALVNGR